MLCGMFMVSTVVFSGFIITYDNLPIYWQWLYWVRHLRAHPTRGGTASSPVPQALRTNRSTPCPTQQTHAIGLWAARKHSHGSHSQREIRPKSWERVTSPKEL